MKFLTIVNGVLLLDDVVVTSADHFVVLADGADVLRSSSVDFPHDYTSDPDVLATVAAIDALY